ncbi:pentatricopeptide repeat-containing protein At5g66500, mitochondrial [Eucalyptus grandis]|uniref:pentatricopeptide repeat-containing protein At5g66500, mitochondrial n=1 Tax=Eucalyptus grandis TaxID=71139 RepID=UPI00192EBBDC|nr:pentatricopeptide repeat-containing protein At5g66500, mitochondrial [Eucalyptus grandis]
MSRPIGRCLTRLPAKPILGILKASPARAVPTRELHARHPFDEIPHRDLRSVNSLLASRVRCGDAAGAWDLFLRLRSSRTDLDVYTFTPVLSACSALPHPQRGRLVHGLMIKTGTDSGTISKTALVDVYSKYGCLSESVKVFGEMEFKDVVSWNALLSSFLRHGLAKDALHVFEDMRKENVEISEFTLCSMLKACALLEAYSQGKQVHGMVVVMGRDLVVLSTALIDFYSSVGRIEEALKLYDRVDCSESVMRNAMISACVRNLKYKEAFSIMSSMKPNVIALTSALAACSENSDLGIGKQIHCVAIRFGFTSDTQLCNVLLDMYAKCGKVGHAKMLFGSILRKDVVSWTTMIDAYGINGNGLDAFLLFNKMGELRSEVSPNNVTLLAVLSACGHSGLVDQGRASIDLARDKYGLNAGPEHYACFIDGLGRAGRIEDAWRVFHETVEGKCRPNAAVWAALLNACSLNRDFSRGERAAKQLLELEPIKPGNYVLVSNFYADFGMWDYVDAMRNEMKKKGLVKGSGSSWVTAKPP